MIAAEMAALAPYGYGKRGPDRPARPVARRAPDHRHLHACCRTSSPPLLFHDVAAGTALLAGGVDFSDSEAIQRFLIGNNRRLGTAGKILFPIPNRRLSKRLYRLTNETLVVWGDDDRLLPTPYADAWARALPNATTTTIADAGHLAPYEQPDAVAEAITAFLRG